MHVYEGAVALPEQVCEPKCSATQLKSSSCRERVQEGTRCDSFGKRMEWGKNTTKGHNNLFGFIILAYGVHQAKNGVH